MYLSKGALITYLVLIGIAATFLAFTLGYITVHDDVSFSVKDGMAHRWYGEGIKRVPHEVVWIPTLTMRGFICSMVLFLSWLFLLIVTKVLKHYRPTPLRPTEEDMVGHRIPKYRDPE